jgi:hypothetical protein
MNTKMKKKTVWPVIAFMLLIVFVFGHLLAEEMPRPTYDNSVIFSMTYSLNSSDVAVEAPYLKSRFGKGIYAPLCCSSFEGVNMGWHVNIDNAANNIQTFKNTVNSLVSKAKTYGTGIHVILTYGLSRNASFYDDAKDEDIRNAMWYNDNNFLSEGQWNKAGTAGEQDGEQSSGGEWRFNHNKVAGEASSPRASGTLSAIQYALATHSRYARKLRKHLEAKVEAAMDYLALMQQQNPDLLLVVSAPGEAEMNLHPVNRYTYLQEYFCDYSPFAVLEFRDWIRHEGLYANGEKYAGEGYEYGGGRYQGAGGLANFNADFGTAFTTWDLKYFHWSLTDPVDTDFTDYTNPDPNVIGVEDYTFDGMMPVSGPHYTAGGFDPPRVMRQKGENDFYDLWHLFRETMVHHYVKDMASIARSTGFNRSRYYTHQIPADYLFGTRPNDPSIPYLNPRYYSSASPLWTADAYADTGMGITMYDINFGTFYARTSQYILPEISGVSTNWGVMEYNPEVVPSGFNVEMSSPQEISAQIMRLYNYDAHFFAFFKWTNTLEHQYKGTNREAAAKLFFDDIKDKARRPLSTVFTPKTVEQFSGYYHSTSGAINLSWSRKIWSDLDHTWSDWGDFKEFVIYRGYTETFQANASSEIARTTDYSYSDSGFTMSDAVYYRIAAVNVNGETGDTVIIGVGTGTGETPALEVSKNQMQFGASADAGHTAVYTQTFFIENTGGGVLNWTVEDDADWLECTPPYGMNSAVVTVTVNASGKAAGTYTGVITVSDPNAENSPQTVTVTLRIYKEGQDSQPFGKFETPLSGSTVRSSVPFTGWALDDIEVESVKIYLKQENNLNYIGDALFVEGARPDVETAYSQYPNSSRAGWGYMMLTNFLPNGGNGTYTFHAIAADSSGHEVTLGTTTVTIDNAHAVKPFGAIDTPAQGGAASGSNYRNNGWVLTPMPNSIPTSGSTINVYIDGVYLGHPVYNIYRSDVASLFPGYTNSDGAHGYFDIDTTAYADGIHTIYWTARDSAGNTDGIGSRYFSINNPAARGANKTASAKVFAGSRGSFFKKRPWPPEPACCRTRFARPRSYSMLRTSSQTIIGSPSVGPVQVVKGFEMDAEPQKIYPGRNGDVKIEIHELERIEIRSVYAGYQVVDGGLRRLPIGSTMDVERGIFYWLPGPGFLGEYGFVFVMRDKNGTYKRRNITIKILPGVSH